MKIEKMKGHGRKTQEGDMLRRLKGKGKKGNQRREERKDAGERKTN